MITFIIPSIARPTIARTFQSLTAQSCPDWLAILVYDGFYLQPSTNEPRILWTWIYPKLGTGNAAAAVRAKAIPLVRTKWIGFVDDDDSLDPNYVQWLKEAEAKHPEADVFVFRMQEHSQMGRVLPSLEITDPKELGLGKVGISFCVRAELMRSVNWGSNWCEDWDLLNAFISSGKSVVLLPHVGYRVRF
jgi:hypothetical protein